ncbi:MAG TPA: DNA mismatch repair endonuclease MutH [Polyangiaceae bacterium]|nr:DNA mismatch repair endonuclease MutH [Polyangiaceae bacterium]
MASVSPSAPPAPANERELVERAARLAGVSLGELAARLGRPVPGDLRRAKGFVGQLVELGLGATAGSRAGPDFAHLGIELKTLPVDARGRPVESTFVCTISLPDVGDVEWERSPVRAKLARVLFVPVEGERERPVAERRLGAPLVWSPNEEDERDLKFDWDELAGRIGRGDVESITGHLGRYLQVRPKAADSHARRRAFDRDGVAFAALPRGFYLRALFTARIVRTHYALAR